MGSLTPQQRRSRQAYDWNIVQAMNGGVFTAAAYRTTSDLEAKRNPVVTLADAEQATKYVVEFRVPTIAGRGKPLQPITTVGFDLAVGNYPYAEPASWVIGPVPYSPHFKQGMPVCLGELWREAKGKMLFALLLVHVAKILNWDEEKRGSGYQGWNGDAIKLHAEIYGNQPIDPAIRYPALPAELTHGISANTGMFGASAIHQAVDLFGPAALPVQPVADASDLFSGS